MRNLMLVARREYVEEFVGGLFAFPQFWCRCYSECLSP